MKKVLVLFLLASTNIFSQPLFQEEFNLTDGTILSSPWNVTGIPPYINEGNLTYEGYYSQPGSRRLFLNYNSNNTILSASFSMRNTGTVYCSFLVNLNSELDLSTTTSAAANYFFYFGSSSVYRAHLFIRRSGSNTYQIGLGNKFSSTPQYVAVDLAVNITYLVVVGYSFSAGAESAKLWINPSLTGTEPVPDADIILQSIGSVSRIIFHQQTFTGDMYIDAIRVADSWSQAPLPVELSSFSARQVKDGVELRWMTKTEVNNYGFQIERSSGSNAWECIGFVNGAGNSNAERQYSFYDEKTEGEGILYYRLKQVDTDGSFSYSGVEEVYFENPGYALYQNYPNPFNPETKIRWVQKKEGNVTLKILNSAGEVMQRITLFKSAGEQEFIFSGAGLSSGVYFYEIEVNGYNARKSMLLLK